MKGKIGGLFVSMLIVAVSCDLHAQQTEVRYLSGTDKDNTVQWDFFCTKGMNSGKWMKIAVPSIWEQQNFGNYNYGHDKVKHDEQVFINTVLKCPPTGNRKKYLLFLKAV